MGESGFKNKVVLITGAASGLGATTALKFEKSGAALILSDIDSPGLDQTTKMLESHTKYLSETVDISDEKSWISLIEQSYSKFGRIDVAINNAGIGQALLPLHQTSVDEFDRVLSVNTRGVFLGMKHQLPGMIAEKSGVILNIASAAGLVGAGHLAAYSASKHAVVGLTRSAADEVARLGIRVNALCPSFVSTPLFDDMADAVGTRHGLDRAAACDRLTSRIPMRRLARMDEVVQAVLWACDPANSFMTGQAISIDGGLTAI